MKNPLTPAGIEPATFRFVAQHLNHCATAVPIDSRTKHNESQGTSVGIATIPQVGRPSNRYSRARDFSLLRSVQNQLWDLLSSG